MNGQENDASVFAHIQRLAAEEHALFERNSLEDGEREIRWLRLG